MSTVASLLGRLMDLERPLLVALDVDGTLAPIVRDPDSAVIPPRTLSTLAALARVPELELALITGRDWASLHRMEQLEGIWRAVEHGAVILAPGQKPKERKLTPDQREALARFKAWADEHAPDAFVEHKPQAVALHVRPIVERDPERADRLLERADELARSLGLHVRRGKALREAEAVHHDKATAVREILRRSGASSVFFVGDDLTDMGAIELAASKGIGALVGSDELRETPTEAAILLDGIDEVAAV
ncbi:MAG: trehalose-phosphatase, partial [Myxococcales bacterium]